MDPEKLPPKQKMPVLGEDVSALSAHELELRIAQFEAEIVRLRAAIATRHVTKSAAENFFKR